MRLETIQLNKLNPAEYNPRTITAEEFEGLKKSLETFGQQENLIVNKDMTIISGHQRFEAMKALGWTEAVCNMVDLDKHQEKKLNVIMNSTAISGKYDDLKLSEILEELKLDDDYESLRLDKLEPLDLSEVEVEEDEAPEVSSEPPVSKLGEIYQLGRHRVMCGSATVKEDVDKLVNRKVIDMIFTSPPYNISSSMYETYKDNLESTDYIDFNLDTARLCKDIIKRGGSLFWNISYNKNSKWEYIDVIYRFMHELNLKLCETVIWDKKGATPITNKKDLTRAWEYIYHFVNDEIDIVYEKNEYEIYGVLSDGIIETVNKGKSRVKSNLWKIDTSQSQLDNHKACFPVKLPAEAVITFSNEKEIIYEPFLGSGTTLIACEQTDRTCYGMELDPKYVDVIRKRYWKFVNDGNEEGWEDGTKAI